MEGPGRWIDRLMGWCVAILAAALAIYCAVKLIEAVLPALLVVLGILALVGAAIGGIVVFSTLRNRW